MASVRALLSGRRGGGAATPAEAAEYRKLVERRLASIVTVDQPLVLVTQVQRSGGTLLSQLFDDHPECHAHPYELKIGWPTKATWPRLDLAASPEQWWDTLREGRLRRLFNEGYTKYSTGLLDRLGEDAPLETFPFLLPPRVQRALFLALARDRAPRTQREVLDVYMTSFFNAWLDNQNLYRSPKRVITAFTPRLIVGEGNVDAFRADYPDGTLISLVREPKSWFASASRHNPQGYADVDKALALWQSSTRAALAAGIVVTYERLVTETEAVLRALAERIGITYTPSLLEPTFNGMPIRADSAFEVAEHGVVRTALDRGARELDADIAARIDAELGPLYGEAAASSL